MFLGPGRRSATQRRKPFDTHRLGGTSPSSTLALHPHHIATPRSASDTSRLSDKDRILDVFDDLLWKNTFLLSLVISNAGSYDAIPACSHLFIISRLFNRVFNNVYNREASGVVLGREEDGRVVKSRGGKSVDGE